MRDAAVPRHRDGLDVGPQIGGTPSSTHARTIASRPCVSSRKGP